MKKVLKVASKYIFAAFGVAVLGLLLSLTYAALARIFPDSQANRMYGLVLFDIAAMCWAVAFVYASETTAQYATAAIGFVVGFVGTLFMVAAEVALSSGQMEAGDIGQYMIYAFIVVTALHAALLYAHHATGQEIRQQIDVGIARGEIVSTAIDQATKQLDAEKSELAHSIHQDIVSQVKRDLGIVEADPDMPFLPKAEPEATEEKPQGFLDRMRDKFKAAPQPVTKTYEQTTMPILEDKPRKKYYSHWCEKCQKETTDGYMGECSECNSFRTAEAKPKTGGTFQKGEEE